MKSLEAKLLQIGNARGIRLPAAMIRKHQLDGGVVLEERDGEIVLRSKQAAKKLSWEETAQQMAAAGEDWSDWEAVADGWNGEGNATKFGTPASNRSKGARSARPAPASSSAWMP